MKTYQVENQGKRFAMSNEIEAKNAQQAEAMGAKHTAKKAIYPGAQKFHRRGFCYTGKRKLVTSRQQKHHGQEAMTPPALFFSVVISEKQS